VALQQFIKDRKRKIWLVLIDIACYIAVCIFFLLARIAFDGMIIGNIYKFAVNMSVMLVVTVYLRVFVFHVYGVIWRYANTQAYIKLVLTDVVSSAIAIMISLLCRTYTNIWPFAVVACFNALACLMMRFFYRSVYKKSHLVNWEEKPHINVAIVGAGQVGVLLANDLLGNSSSIYRPMFFIDTDKAKVGSTINNLPVYDEASAVTEQIKENNVSEIFIALTNVDSEKVSELYYFYRHTGCKVKLYDAPIRDFDGASGDKRMIRDFHIEDLLFRKPLSINDNAALGYYTGKVVLITGGGGSIGSELCRQIAKCAPSRLIIVDIYENNAYDIQQELWRAYGEKLDLCVEIASVRDEKRLDDIFDFYRPDIVFHAAAHKHVPLMEHSATEAIKNNVFGTYNTANIAEKYKVKKFILISTDKAVNPTNIMGASKRICEMIVQCRRDSETSFASVRFGNVLGSNGSVIPLFKRQIANGGPVTITDKRIIRYFMTIPEASQLVMHAGAMANDGELFVLDMGKPVRIYDLAYNMIKLSGYEPGIDIEIKEIGLRPGEKLYEELLMKTETLSKTENEMIFIEKDAPLTRKDIEEKLVILKNAVDSYNSTDGKDSIKKAVISVVPTFHEPSELNDKAEKTKEMKSTRELSQ